MALVGHLPASSFRCTSSRCHSRQQRAPFKTIRPTVVVRSAEVDADAELEKRLEKLRLAKGATPYGQGAKGDNKKSQPEPKKSKGKPAYDYSNETVYYEGGPPAGDLAFNVVLGTTLFWLPLTFAAIGRAAFMKYRFTDKRLSIVSTAPWQTNQTDVAYQEITDVVTVSRALGLWGDMVVTLKDSSKVEIRSLDRFLELKKYVLERRDALAERDPLDDDDDSSAPTKAKGFA